MLPLLIACAGAPAPCADGWTRVDNGGCHPAGPPADTGGAALDTAPTGGDTAAPAGDTAPPPFDGVAAADWDGADGLILRWDPTGAGPYTARLSTPDGEAVAELEVDGAEAHLTGLADGEYDANVSDAAAQGAAVTLRQLVGENRLVFRGELPHAGAMDVWGEGQLVALAGGANPDADVLLVDVSDPAAPVTLSAIEGIGQIRDVKLVDGILYAGAECDVCVEDWETGEVSGYEGWHQVGVWIYDVRDPTAPILLSTIGPPDDSVHNLSVGDGLLFLTSNWLDAVSIYDVSDAGAPRPLGVYQPAMPAAVHDQAYVDGLLYVAWWNGFSAVDVSDPAAPVEVMAYRAPEWADFHNIWPARGGDYVLTSEEAVGGHLKVWDARDPQGVFQVGGYITAQDHSVHNVHTRATDQGEWAFVSWYVDGVMVFDLADPADPAPVGWFDSYDGEEGPVTPPHSGGDVEQVPRVQGAWGVWPYGEHVAVGDTERGLLLLDFFPPSVTRP